MSLEQRVTTLEQYILQQGAVRLDPTNETDKRLSRLENKVDHLENKVDQNTIAIEKLGQRVDRLEVKVDRLEVKVDQLEVKVDRLEVKVDQLEVKVDRLEVKVDQLEVKVDQLDQRVGRLEVKFDQLDQKMDRVEQNLRADMADGFKQLSNQISSLGNRWGVQNESIWRQTIASLLEKSYGITVKRLDLGADEIDVLVSNGDHILLEITSRFHQRDVAKITRKRQLYTDQVQAPTRFIVAAASIHSKVAQQLMGLGFEVIEPDED